MNKTASVNRLSNLRRSGSKWRSFVVFPVLAVAAFAPGPLRAMDYVNIAVGSGPEHEVRYTSGKTLYVEGLVNGRWDSRWWAADGRIPFPYWEFAEPAFQITMKDAPGDPARLVSSGWQWVSAGETQQTRRGARHFIVHLRNPAAQLDVKVHTLLDGTPVMVRWLEIKNTAKKPRALVAVAPWSARLWSEPGRFEYMASWPWLSFEWKELKGGSVELHSREGNGFDDPFFIVRNDQTGTCFVCALAWSANYEITFHCQPDGSKPDPGLSFSIGPEAKDALRVIGPGETIRTPAVHLGYLEGDFDSVVQAMDDHVRRSVLPRRDPKRAYRIEVDQPGDQGYFTGSKFNEANVRKCIDIAAAIGAETFILDCPWYDYPGDWTPSPTRFPHGIRPLVEYAHHKGLFFGLQTEVEGGRGDHSRSQVYRQHPDWFGKQNVMRLDRPEVAAYMRKKLSWVISSYHPDLYRNEFIPGGANFHTYEWMSSARDGFMENDYWRYYDHWDDVWRQLRKQYPKVVWQQCANGGTREDLNAMGLFDESYTAEGPLQPMLECLSAKTLSLPPEVLVLGLDTSVDRGHLDTYLRAQYTLCTPQWVTLPAPALQDLSPVLLQRIRHYSNLYKHFIRPILPRCKVFHHEPDYSRHGANSSPWFAMEFDAPDGSAGWATIVRVNPGGADDYVFRPRGLRRDRTYRVTFDSSDQIVRMDGSRLIQDGIRLRLPSVLSSELLLFQAEPNNERHTAKALE